MFHFPAFPPHTLCVQVQVTGHNSSRVAPFGHPRITARLSAPRGLSQIPTSFFGSWYQGIHRAPIKTWPQRCSRPLYKSQNTTTSTPAHTHPPPHRSRKAVCTPAHQQPQGNQHHPHPHHASPHGPTQHTARDSLIPQNPTARPTTTSPPTNKGTSSSSED